MIRRVVIAAATVLIVWLGLIAPATEALAIPDRVERTHTQTSR